MTMNRYIKTLISTVSIVSLFTACTHKELALYQDGDEILNCKKLTTKIADIIDINNDINGVTGLEPKSIAAWVIWPIAGGLNQVNASTARDKLDKRFIYLIKLKQKNNCNITIKERSFIKNKGRVSDTF